MTEVSEFKSQKLSDHGIRDILARPRQQHSLFILLKQPQLNMPADGGAGQVAQSKSGRLLKLPAVNPFRATKILGDRLPSALLTGQLLGLKRGRFAGESLANVTFQVARVEFTPAADIAGRAHAESVVSVVCPIDLVVMTTPARPSEVRDFVMLETGSRQRI